MKKFLIIELLDLSNNNVIITLPTLEPANDEMSLKYAIETIKNNFDLIFSIIKHGLPKNQDGLFREIEKTLKSLEDTITNCKTSTAKFITCEQSLCSQCYIRLKSTQTENTLYTFCVYY
jgi:predicted peroxiredoxin